MVDWESKYGKNFTQSSKFRELADSISGAIKEGGFSGINAIPGNVPLRDPTQQVQVRPSNAPLTAPAAPDGRGRTKVVILPPGGQNSGANPNSASSGSQSTLPKFSATDPRNTELIVIKSIYNIVG